MSGVTTTFAMPKLVEDAARLKTLSLNVETTILVCNLCFMCQLKQFDGIGLRSKRGIDVQRMSHWENFSNGLFCCCDAKYSVDSFDSNRIFPN